MNLRIKGSLTELRQLYQVLSTRYNLSGSKLYPNAMPNEDRGSIKRQIPPFPPSEITDEMIKSYGERTFRLYVSNVTVGTNAKL
ncbi:hypothetical protein [Laspinema olomoucense]|uniref:Uncharacterized protein n=1 Tax=Laspinema olomoucense D3b TaxID=2953688 RepID=A0ABT2NFQ1_9CYAN|nr:hypothetical protein [Laspinema sp. D3b]MCT7981538.1 hypothetical protein [Laspinema sp. D3b]